MKLNYLFFLLLISILLSNSTIAQNHCIQTILENQDEEVLNKIGKDKMYILQYKESYNVLSKYKSLSDSLRQAITKANNLNETEQVLLTDLIGLVINPVSGDAYNTVRTLPRELVIKLNVIFPLSRLYSIDAQSKRHSSQIESSNKWAAELCKYCNVDTMPFSKAGSEIMNYAFEENDVIADIGAGHGILEKALAKFCNNLSIYANDVVPDLMDSLQTRLAFLDVLDKKTIHYHTVTGSKTSTMLPVNKFDKVIVKNAFHHFECPGEMVIDFKNILKKEGSLFIVDLMKEEEGEKHFCEFLFPRQVMFRYLEDNGFQLVHEIELDYNNFRLFEFKVGRD